ncbi:MAG TPA: SRPBCC family protein [Cytophagales bacterium]|nr:SRPBCC family protein [Cytophagales bacterium]
MEPLTITTIAINCPITEVYKFVINMENFKLWFPEVMDIKSDDQRTHGVVGKKYLETVRLPFKGVQKISLTVVQSEDNKLFITEGMFLPLLPRMVVKFTEDAHKITSLTWSMHSRNDSFIFKTLFLPFIQKVIEKRATVGLQNLKKILESNNDRLLKN